GTSLLATSLNAHKNILISWQPYWLFFKACRNKFFKEIMKKPLDSNYPMGILQFSSRKERDLFRDIFTLIKFDTQELSYVISQIKAYLSDKKEKINKNMKPLGLLRYLYYLESGTAGHVLTQLSERLYHSEIYNYKANKDDTKIIGIKEAFCEEYTEPILNYQALDSVVLHIIRDPRAVVASRNYGKYMEATGSKYPIFFIIRSWLRTVANYILNKDNDNYLMIKYEDLVRQPEEILKHICVTLGVEFSKDIINFEKYTDSEGNKWESNSSFSRFNTINTSSVDRWKDVLSFEEIEIIEYYCKSEMELMGYESTKKQFDIGKILNFQEDMSQVRSWLRNYDFSFKTLNPALISYR
ncbi:MAG: sulfotransferase, partial [Thermodesulfobacteriota bacterium]|nr:sulfotransferase [Thermodesulfobacteriota bacterium]